MKLLESLDLGFLTLKNRVVMGSMHTGLEGSSQHAERYAQYLSERAKGGVGLIITGGYSPNRRGWLVPFSSKLTSHKEAETHKKFTVAVHQHGGRIALQILHAGRYSVHPFCVAPSSIKSVISPFKPWEMSERNIFSTIQDFATTAELAKSASYDGVEIMGSEGYLLNQFFSPRTNLRTDKWGGSLDNRMRFPLEIVKEVRKRVGPNFLIIFRISLMDLVEQGATFSDVITFGKALEAHGVNILSSGIGWHEARVPTIATDVPRGSFTWVTKEFKKHIKIPVIAANRINTPEVAEEVLTSNSADLVSMARPLLADPEFVRKVQENRKSEVNTCIACNQACLDHVFQRKIASCLVNPRAAFESELPFTLTNSPKRIAVVGAGPAGLSFATTAASRGHDVTLFEAQDKIGGQFNYASLIPGKEEFKETLRYYQKQLEIHQVKLKLNTHAPIESLLMFDEIVISTGVRPRKISFPGSDHPHVVSYPDIITGVALMKSKVAIIGAGGIGFDVAKLLTHQTEANFFESWGIDTGLMKPGSLTQKKTLLPKREVYLLQRKKEGFGRSLGKTTGWIHRLQLKDHQVKMISGVQYKKFDENGLHISSHGKDILLGVEQVIICAGQDSQNSLYEELRLATPATPLHLIGGALKASEVDAKRAIREGVTLGLTV